MLIERESVDLHTGKFCYDLVSELYPICRSLTGPGVRETLQVIKKYIPELSIKEIESGKKVFDWTIPDEWSVSDAYVEDHNGKKVVDFSEHNLHLVGYSEPVDTYLTLEELNQKLYSLPSQPDAIPYVTSYYSRGWGFCLTQYQRDRLLPGTYHAVIKSEFKKGVLNYGELLIPGKEKKILLSTYICHPSMANNELSGPAVTVALTQWLFSLANRCFSYRIIFIPETIGSIAYLSNNLEYLKANVVAGFNVTCIGDDRCYSYLPSRSGQSLSDQAAQHVLRYIDSNYKKYSWLDRGSDERQYCAPGVDLPVASIMRSKYGEYPEYHTSLDDLSLVSAVGLEGGGTALKNAIEVIEANCYPKITVLCEPQLGKRGLYPQVSTKESGLSVQTMMNFISYCDGKNSLLDIAELINVPMLSLNKILQDLIKAELIKISYEKI